MDGFLSYEVFEARAIALRGELAEACRRAGRDPKEVRILAVTKTHPPAAAEYAARFGLEAVGENRVQEGVDKRARTAAPIRWELIGHLQSNKAALAARHFDRIQSVDSVKLAGVLDRAAAELGRSVPILIQINAGEDPAKFGASLADGPALLEAALSRPGLRVEGLMTIAPLSPDPAAAARAFGRLREARDRWAAQFGAPLPELSMGMSGDWAQAVAAGSTLVRVGSALFGARA